ncbi:leucine-rich repeat domain-containing protein [Chryseobacterium oryctis]|uniref:Leucine-rich repeat domain-containing protein n=1 Tax=Chryseobacterium oryctis TaxID=2952618 RepID=A0ABT3HP12_9FLAO|nr:leucine-rich repeat domain-containing protein [Chryseobacterium oryctis]MCW3161520.1 leucine-rich repeat domain-containing protein [Chryseobacterium oryctis]
MRNLFKLLVLIPLLYSCQKYNNSPFDEKEKKLRQYPVEKSKTIVLDSLWDRRDSLTYLKLKNLEIIAMNETTHIPNWISEFKKLEIFQVINENKKIKSVPSDIGRLSNLIQFEIQNNNVTKLPSSFYKLTNLKYLNLSNNPIKFIDNKIGNLKKLEVLSLDSTKIKEIPATVCNLDKLKILSIKNTNIHALPSCMMYLNDLTTLDISLTQIGSFPIEILNAQKLDLIDAKGLKLKNYQEVKAICEMKNIRFSYDE